MKTFEFKGDTYTVKTIKTSAKGLCAICTKNGGTAYHYMYKQSLPQELATAVFNN